MEHVKKIQNQAIFLDRDGVLNEVTIRDGKPYPPRSPSETRIYYDVPQALSLLKSAGYLIAVITNQPDVARGIVTRHEVEAINSRLLAELPIDHIEVCYHDDSDCCECRKPKPGLIWRAAHVLGAEPERAYLVGDRWRDIEAGRVAGCRTVWIDRGYLEKIPVGYNFRAESLLAAAKWIIQQRHWRKDWII